MLILISNLPSEILLWIVVYFKKMSCLTDRQTLFCNGVQNILKEKCSKFDKLMSSATICVVVAAYFLSNLMLSSSLLLIDIRVRFETFGNFKFSNCRKLKFVLLKINSTIIYGVLHGWKLHSVI